MTEKELEQFLEETKYHHGEKYDNHMIFTLLDDIIDFYNRMEDKSSCQVNSMFCVKDIPSIDSHLFPSVRATVISIKQLLKLAHINDAFSLVRKYEDAVLLCIYIGLFLNKEHEVVMDRILKDDPFLFENLYKNKINEWVKEGNKFDLKVDESKIATFDEVKELNNMFKLQSEKTGKQGSSDFAKSTLRQFCNNNVHYNALKYFSYNNPTSYNYRNTRIKLLDAMLQSMTNIFIVHFSYTLVINPIYFTSDDYVDALNLKEEPIEGSQNLIAPFIQELIDKYIKSNKELYGYLKDCNFLEIK